MAKAKKAAKRTSASKRTVDESVERKPAGANELDCVEQEHGEEPARPGAEAEEKFVEDTLIRGDAAKPDEAGNLPGDATHEIVEEREGELPTIRRRRFKAF